MAHSHCFSIQRKKAYLVVTWGTVKNVQCLCGMLLKRLHDFISDTTVCFEMLHDEECCLSDQCYDIKIAFISNVIKLTTIIKEEV